MKYFRAGEASSALCLFVYSPIRGQETKQGYVKALHFLSWTNILFFKSQFFKYLFVCSPLICGQETIQGYGKAVHCSDDHLLFSLTLHFPFCLHCAEIVCLVPFCFAMKPHCVAFREAGLARRMKIFTSFRGLVDKYRESMHTNLLPFSNKYCANMQEMCVSLEQDESIYKLSSLWLTMFGKYSES